MARVHDLLSKSEKAQRVDVSVYVADLCQALKPITENDDRVRLEAKMDDGMLVDADTAVPLGIVLTELITNAVKYAFPAPRSGTILVQARRSQPGWAELVVRMMGSGCRVYGKDHSGMAWFGLSSSRSGVRSTCAAMPG
jgi:two-component sensor histidine kinase